MLVHGYKASSPGIPLKKYFAKKKKKKKNATSGEIGGWLLAV
jgi:hypothetical protein